MTKGSAQANDSNVDSRLQSGDARRDGNGLARIDTAVRDLWDRPGGKIELVLLGVAILLGFFSIATDRAGWALSAGFTVLTVLTVSSLAATLSSLRRDADIQSICNELKQLGSSTSAVQAALDQTLYVRPILKPRTDLANLGMRAQAARDVLCIGLSLGGVSRDRELWENRLRDGASVRLAFLDIDNQGLCEVASRALGISVASLKSDIQTTINVLESIKANYGGACSANLQVRALDHVPSLSLVCIDGETDYGHLSVELIPYGTDPSHRPHMLLTPKVHSEWYSYFHSKAEEQWDSLSAYPGI